jgi:hypothetical protein
MRKKELDIVSFKAAIYPPASKFTDILSGIIPEDLSQRRRPLAQENYFIPTVVFYRAPISMKSASSLSSLPCGHFLGKQCM